MDEPGEIAIRQNTDRAVGRMSDSQIGEEIFVEPCSGLVIFGKNSSAVRQVAVLNSSSEQRLTWAAVSAIRRM